MPDNPMGDFVDAIREFWWQSETPPIPGHRIGKDLSVVKTWLRQGYERDELLGALRLYEGNPVTLLVTHARGQRHLISRLVGEFKKTRAIRDSKVGSVLQKMAREGVL